MGHILRSYCFLAEVTFKAGELDIYLGINENISFDSATNKERVLTEYFKSQ